MKERSFGVLLKSNPFLIAQQLLVVNFPLGYPALRDHPSVCWSPHFQTLPRSISLDQFSVFEFICQPVTRGLLKLVWLSSSFHPLCKPLRF